MPDPSASVTPAAKYSLCDILVQVEHRPPDCKPSFTLFLKHPHIPARCAVSFPRTFVDHLKPETDPSRIPGNINLMIMLTEFMNCGVLGEIAERREKAFPPPRPPREPWKDHDYL